MLGLGVIHPGDIRLDNLGEILQGIDQPGGYLFGILTAVETDADQRPVRHARFFPLVEAAVLYDP